MESGIAQFAAIQTVPGVHHQGSAHDVGDSIPIEPMIFIPVGQQEQCMCSTRGVIGVVGDGESESAGVDCRVACGDLGAMIGSGPGRWRWRVRSGSRRYRV